MNWRNFSISWRYSQKTLVSVVVELWNSWTRKKIAVHKAPNQKEESRDTDLLVFTFLLFQHVNTKKLRTVIQISIFSRIAFCFYFSISCFLIWHKYFPVSQISCQSLKCHICTYLPSYSTPDGILAGKKCGWKNSESNFLLNCFP